MTKAQQREELAALVRKARFGKQKLRITRCPPGAYENNLHLRRQSGGMLPAHLNPVTLGGN